MRPIIVGCTSDVLDQRLLDKCAGLGFEDMFNAPLTEKNIEEGIMPFIIKRQFTMLSFKVEKENSPK